MPEERKVNKPQEKTPVLDKFGTDITMLAKQGKIDPIVGRQVEVRRVCQILSRKKKNNPMLIGEAGVGKTNIAQGVAIRILEKNCPSTLFDKRIFLLDLSAIVAGTTYRGQFEERMIAILDEVQRLGNIILFIDEVHTLIGAGSASGSLDASNIIKPALANGLLQVIAATTLKEYRENFEDDAALSRRFQIVIVEPTSLPDTLEILKGIKSQYEKHHKVKYTDKALEACVYLSDRYITDRQLPDKAIDLLDEVGAASNFAAFEIPKDIIDLEQEIEYLDENKRIILKDAKYEEAILIRDRTLDLKMLLKEAYAKFEEFKITNKKLITDDQVADVVTQITGIPVSKMQDADIEFLQAIDKDMKMSVIGQDQAVDAVVKAVKRRQVGLADPEKPMSFMFLGSTGTGKTHVAKNIARILYKGGGGFFRIDMSEYQERNEVSRLIGAPPGYVGYREGGQLTEKVRRKPYCVVLLDEIEKAHPDVYNILLQILDDGRITDGLGRTINFKHCVIIMTSNVGAKTLQNFGVGAGFITSTRDLNRKIEEEGVLKKELKKKFSPEFINRINEIIIFNTLTKENILKITDLELAKTAKKLTDLKINILFDLDTTQMMADKGFDAELGARPISRVIEKEIEDQLADLLLEKKVKEGDTVKVSIKNDKVTLNVTNK